MLKKRFGLIKNFSVKARLHTAGFAALAALAVTGGGGYIGLETSSAGLEASITATSAVLNQMNGDMKHDVLRSDVVYAVLTGPDGDQQIRHDIGVDVVTHANEFETAMDKLLALPLAPDLRDKVQALRPTIANYVSMAKDSVTLALNDADAGRTRLPVFMESFSAVEKGMADISAQIEEIGNTTAEAATVHNRLMLQIVLYSSITAALIIFLSNILIGRSIAGPLRRIQNAIKEVASGDLGGRHSAFERVSDLNDEVSQIAIHLEQLRVRLRQTVEMEAAIKRTQATQQEVVEALTIGLENLSNGNLTQELDQTFAPEYEGLRANYNRTVERLNQTMTQVVTSSRSIRARADDINTASEDLARRTENQAATLEQTAAALDELTASVRSAATGAREVEGIVQNAKREANESGKVVESAVDAMNGIERSSDQISQIIGVIDDIAFQTNLLALNAGVEAARAGDAGRGFAVVASEVRALAQRSSDASKEIKTLISSSRQLVGRGVQAVGSAGKALNTLVERVTHISGLVTDIATGAAEQSNALQEVNVGVTQLDQVAQRNAAMVEQSMNSAHSLHQDAVGLDDLVSQFTTQPGHQAAPTYLRAAS